MSYLDTLYLDMLGVVLDKDGPGAPFAPRKPGLDRLAAEAAEVARIRQRDEALVRSLRWL